jgi:hypothetical protein
LLLFYCLKTFADGSTQRWQKISFKAFAQSTHRTLYCPSFIYTQQQLKIFGWFSFNGWWPSPFPDHCSTIATLFFNWWGALFKIDASCQWLLCLLQRWQS